MYHRNAVVCAGIILGAALTMAGCGSKDQAAAPVQTEAAVSTAESSAKEQQEQNGQADVPGEENKTETGRKMPVGGTVEAGPDIAVADTRTGKVQGYISNGIYTYRGIPYARAAERFTEAGPVEAWEGVRMAFDYGTISPQVAAGAIAGGDHMDNDCQNLNVWTPGIGDGKKRPVMVWLHGGGFSTGSSIESEAYDGENLSSKGDVVVVSVNHRLNVLGHLNLSQYGGKYKNSGNPAAAPRFWR